MIGAATAAATAPVLLRENICVEVVLSPCYFKKLIKKVE